MSKGPDALARIQLVTRHEQISHSALKLQSSHQSFQRAFDLPPKKWTGLSCF